MSSNGVFFFGQLPREEVGIRIAKARKHRGLTVRELAEMAGIDKNAVVRLEKGRGSLESTYLRVCEALQLHPDFVTFDEPTSQTPAVHRLSQDRWWRHSNYNQRTLEEGRPLTDRQRATMAADGESALVLSFESRLIEGQLRPGLLELYGESEWRRHPGEEFVIVQRGSLRITVGETETILSEGEAITFWSDEPHRYAQHGDISPTRILTVQINRKTH